MKNKVKLLCLIISLSFLTAGCAKKTKTVVAPSKTTPTETKTPEPIAQKYLSPYTGEEVTKEISENIALLAIVENSVAARPQSGLNAADIIYETMAEGGTPRFMALFQKDTANKIGPIRSARPYFLELAKEYNLPFAHCGGSAEALDEIKNENMKSLNEMKNASTYLRDNSNKKRVAPHNLYTSSKKLKALIKTKDYVQTPIVKLKFDKTYWDNDKLKSASNILLKMNSTYSTGYTYSDGNYSKNMDGKPANNKEDNLPLTVKNIVVQVTTIKTQADNYRLDIALVGSGDGYVISNGKFTKMHWSKKDATSQTLLTDESGNDLPLNAGKTWWNIVDKITKIDIK
ncbi:MAG: DUF3048 domain-containing protein [Clostridium sp.]|uniref:DUF3048 domain-containing protein n=1 Tax=Clostridium sp. TaxID=1506 RepID=UPI003D6D7D79